MYWSGALSHTQVKGRDHVIVRALKYHPKGHTGCLTYMVYKNLCYAEFLVVGLMQISAYLETLSIVYCVGIHVDFSIMIVSLDP